MSNTNIEERKSSKSKYENLNNYELKFEKNPREILDKNYSYSKGEYSSESFSGKRHSNSRYRRNISPSRSRSRSNSRRKNSNSYYREDKKHSHHHHHHHRHRHRSKYDRDSGSRNKRKNRYKEEEEDNIRRKFLKTSAYIHGKSSNIFYDDNYLPLSNNSFKYIGKSTFDDNFYLDKFDEIPISANNSKKNFELYVINLPKELTEDQISELLNTALISIEANYKSNQRGKWELFHIGISNRE